MEAPELNFLDSIKKTLEDAIAFRPISATIGELKANLEYIDCMITVIELEEEQAATQHQRTILTEGSIKGGMRSATKVGAEIPARPKSPPPSQTATQYRHGTPHKCTCNDSWELKKLIYMRKVLLYFVPITEQETNIAWADTLELVNKLIQKRKGNR